MEGVDLLLEALEEALVEPRVEARLDFAELSDILDAFLENISL